LGLGFQGLEPWENAHTHLIRITGDFQPRRGKLFAKAREIKRGWPWVGESIHGGYAPKRTQVAAKQDLNRLTFGHWPRNAT